MLLAEFVKDFGIKKYFRTTNNIKYSLLSNFIQLVLEGDWIGRLDIPKDFSQTAGISKYFRQLNTKTDSLRFGDVYIVLSSARYRYGVFLDDETVIEQPNHLDAQHKIIKYNVTENTAALEARGYTVIWLRPLNEKNIFPPYMLGANSYTIPTVDAMKAIDLPEGMVVTTSGYYTPEDGAGATYKIVTGSYTDDGGMYHKLNNNNYAQLIVENKTISVRIFGAKGNGTTDDTNAFKLAQAVCATGNRTLFIPRGNYVISEELAFPNYYQIVGEGYGSNIVLNLAAGQFAFVYRATEANYRLAWTFGNLRFTIKTGASSDVGAVYLEGNLRGGKIHDVWTYELQQPFYFGAYIYGDLKVSGIRSYLINLLTLSPRTAISVNSNTVFMDDVEVLGRWMLGINIKHATVGSLINFNIGGSTTEHQMRNAIYLENTRAISIANGWIEQLDDIFYTNGIAQAIYIKDSDHISLQSINVSSGSIYFDGGSRNDIKTIFYAQVNGGIKHFNNADFTIVSSGLKTQLYEYGFGQPYQLDVLRTNVGGVSSNPTLLDGTIPITPTNAGVVTITSNTTDFESGTRSMQVNTVINQGASLTFPVVANKHYTLVVRAKIIEGAGDIVLVEHTDTVRPGGYLHIGGTKTTGEWKTFIFPARSSTSTLRCRLLARNGTDTATFLIDSVQLWNGVNHLSPHLLT